MEKQITISEKDFAKIIAMTIYGYSVGVLGESMSKEEIEHIQEATEDAIKEGGFIEELVETYDKGDFTEFDKELNEVREELGL